MWKNISWLGIVSLGFLLFITPVQARENVTDWYVKDFRAEFVLTNDSTMIVTEWITADCGECSGKHGIFRIVPTEARTEKDTVPMPVSLVSITDFNGVPYPYTTTESRGDHTVTWKIGDPHITVTGEHQYKIVYSVDNVIRFSNQQFDEFYFNILGNFWTMDIDAFSADIVFPEMITNDTTQVSLYTGALGSKNATLAWYQWKNGHVLSVMSTVTPLYQGQGVTVSVTVPKGIFTPYHFGWWERFGEYLWFAMPLGVFFLCFRMWRKYGDDPKWDKVVIPEYEPPKGLSILEFGMLMTNGNFKNEFVTATIIQLAVRGYLTISEEEKKILFISTKDFVLTKQLLSAETLAPDERLVYDKIFETGDTISLSVLRNSFPSLLVSLRLKVVDLLHEKNLIDKSGLSFRVGFLIFGISSLVVYFIFFIKYDWVILAIAGFVSSFIFIIFGLIMPKRQLQGAEVNWQIQGLKLYMNTAEKYRQQFHEKEGIFEALLPYAIVFGMTREWIKKMQDIYGEAYFQSYHPAWFMASGIGSFDVDSFTTHLESLSADIASSTGASSGSGGGGSSGGGGGGGGGGGW